MKKSFEGFLKDMEMEMYAVCVSSVLDRSFSRYGIYEMLFINSITVFLYSSISRLSST